MTGDLQGKCVLVTGGVTGIGGAASEAFAAAGARVFAQYLSGAEEAKTLAAKGIATHKADVTQDGAPARIIAAAREKLGRIDILVNNAGSLVERRLLADFDDHLYDLVLDINVRQVFAFCRAILPVFAAQGRGNIVNVSSVAARMGGSPGSSVYAGTKGFVSAFTKSLAKELAGQKIRVNAVSPGTVYTSFHKRFSTPEKLEITRQTIPMQRLGSAEDIAGTFLYLASDALSGYVTGQVIEVNGGQLMP